MNRIKYLFILLILFQYSTPLYSQEISFYYDKIADSLFSQSEGNKLLENLTRQIWDESSSDWENDSLYEHSYNNKNLVDTIIAHKWRYGTTWGNDLKTAYNYNVNDNIIRRSYFEWAGTNWQEYFRREYSYTGLNQNLTLMRYYWFSNNTWVLYGYYEYSWNANNYLAEIIHYVLSTIGPWIYVETWKDEYYYDSTNVLIMKTGFDAWGGWRPELNDLYFYDNNGNNNENIRQEWNSTDSTWINDYRYLYEYDSNNLLLSVLYQDWQSDSLDWVNVWRETYTYTPQNNIATIFKVTWTPETGWSNYVFRIYFYDSNYNWTEKLTQLWDGSDWKNYYRHLATWLEPVSVEKGIPILNSFYLYQNYPNPFNPSTKIKFTIAQSPLLGGDGRGGVVILKVYDILGNEIATLVNEEKSPGTYEVEFSAIGGSVSGRNSHSGLSGIRDLPSGIYFYTLRAGNFFQTKKMILLK